MSENADRLRRAIEKIDAANSADPHTEAFAGSPHPKELLYSRRMSEWLEHIAPEASEALRLAARAQHIQRWKIPRRSYPMTRAGYRQWRTELGKFHAETTGAILREAGYEPAAIARVQSLLRKQRLKADPECQTLEDVICLVFLEYYAAEFVEQHQHEPEKLVPIFRRTWKKMSERGRQTALELKLSPAVEEVLQQALAAGPAPQPPRGETRL